MTHRKRVLFLCTHNSCRSQMAEGLINHDLGDYFEAFSAGTEATQVNPLAAKVLQEIDIDVSQHYSKTLVDFSGQPFDFVITLCSDADEKCPRFIGGVERVHIGFDDPSRNTGEEAEVLPDYRRVRDDIRDRIEKYLQAKSQVTISVI